MTVPARHSVARSSIGLVRNVERLLGTERPGRLMTSSQINVTEIRFTDNTVHLVAVFVSVCNACVIVPVLIRCESIMRTGMIRRHSGVSAKPAIEPH